MGGASPSGTGGGSELGASPAPSPPVCSAEHEPSPEHDASPPVASPPEELSASGVSEDLSLHPAALPSPSAAVASAIKVFFNVGFIEFLLKGVAF
jgi:hypothetical protein